MSAASDDTPKKMGKSKKGDRMDASRFQSPGLSYKGKLIGVEDVPGPRGDKMCQVAMAKVKAAVKTIGEHKLKIIINISLEGVRITEEKSENIIYFHPVERISFISRDPGDSRAFGYVYGREDGTHQFYGIKTEKLAENIVLNLRDLFQVVFEMKKQEKKEEAREPVGSGQVSASVGTLRKNYSGRNGLEQLNVYPSAYGRQLSSTADSPAIYATCSTSQSPVYQDRKSFGASQGTFPRGIFYHQRSPGAADHSILVAKQYSSLTAADSHLLQSQLACSSKSVMRQYSASDAVTAIVSPITKLRSQHPASSSGQFPVALAPPQTSRVALNSSESTSGGMEDTALSDNWANFDALNCLNKMDDVEAEIIQKAMASESETSTSLFPAECVDLGERVDRYVTSNSGDACLETSPKALLPVSDVSTDVPDSPAILKSCTIYRRVDSTSASARSASGVPTLASPESLSDEDTEGEDEKESTQGTGSFPSPDVPPPPLPLDTVVDLTLQPPVLPPRPKVFELTIIPRSTDQPDSPIYGNMSTVRAGQSSLFTLPRKQPKPFGVENAPATRPIQDGYDLTMPRPRPGGFRSHDDGALPAKDARSFSRRQFQRGHTLNVCESMHPNNSENPRLVLQSSDIQSKNLADRSANNANGDPFAISLGSKLSKPPTFISRSTAATDGLVHTSISPIPRPRPRQKSVPTTLKEHSTTGNLVSNSDTRVSAKDASTALTSLAEDALQLGDSSDAYRIESNRTKQSETTLMFGHRNTEGLSWDKLGRVPDRVQKWSTGSNRSDSGPDPFVQVDPFATENFSDDPFSAQPDPLSFESPSDPFSKEFPKKSSAFCTRAVTVEMGDVFEDSSVVDPDGNFGGKTATSLPDSVKLFTDKGMVFQAHPGEFADVSETTACATSNEMNVGHREKSRNVQVRGSESMTGVAPGVINTWVVADGSGDSATGIYQQNIVHTIQRPKPSAPSFYEGQPKLPEPRDSRTYNESLALAKDVNRDTSALQVDSRGSMNPPNMVQNTVEGFTDSFDPSPFDPVSGWVTDQSTK